MACYMRESGNLHADVAWGRLLFQRTMDSPMKKSTWFLPGVPCQEKMDTWMLSFTISSEGKRKIALVFVLCSWT